MCCCFGQQQGQKAKTGGLINVKAGCEKNVDTWRHDRKHSDSTMLLQWLRKRAEPYTHSCQLRTQTIQISDPISPNSTTDYA
ncbi:hypothetical protein WN943_025818 [Citrus x changshan-huyou]